MNLALQPVPHRLTICLDTEFTGLTQGAKLISLGMVCVESGHTFYAEFSDIDLVSLDPWLKEHVVPHLRFVEPKDQIAHFEITTMHTVGFAKPSNIRAELETWIDTELALYHNIKTNSVRIVADTLAYDWVLFCELFGGARNLPKSIDYIPVDLSTMFFMRGLDPDISRTAFAQCDKDSDRREHNALFDAQVVRKCWERLMHF